MHRTLWAITFAGVAAGSAAAAQSLDTCPGGIQTDDGTFEQSYGASFGMIAYAMRVSPADAVRFDRVCVCFRRNQPSFSPQDPRLALNLKIWRDDEGVPGEILASLDNVRADPVNNSSNFFSWDVSTLDFRTAGPVFVGVEWDASDDEDFFLCADQSGPGGEPAFFGSTTFNDSPSLRLGQVGAFPDYRALGIRVLASPTVIEPTSNCQPDETGACVQEERFRVSIDWRAADGSSGTASAEPFSADTAYFWIFDPDNIEATVKVLNACPLNGHFWVFAGGMTDLEMTISVEDTETGLVQTYSNALGSNFQTVVDTSAFATCQ